MSIFRSKANAAVSIPQYTGLQLQTSSSALPIPIVYGITQVAPNLIWADDFQTQPQYTQQSGKGGGQKTSLSGYTYSAAVIFAICEGPITALGTVFRGQAEHNASEFYLGLYDGSTPQTPWGFLASRYPAAALGYQGTAYGGFELFSTSGRAHRSIRSPSKSTAASTPAASSTPMMPIPRSSSPIFLTKRPIRRRLSRGQHRCHEPLRQRGQRVLPDLLSGHGSGVSRRA